MKKVSVLDVRSKGYPSDNDVTILMIHERNKRKFLQSFSADSGMGA